MKEKDDDSRSILDSFSQVQIRAAQKCLNAPADALMTTINSCYAATYGQFLVEALRRGRTAEQFDQDQTEVEKRTRRSR